MFKAAVCAAYNAIFLTNTHFEVITSSFGITFIDRQCIPTISQWLARAMTPCIVQFGAPFINDENRTSRIRGMYIHTRLKKMNIVCILHKNYVVHWLWHGVYTLSVYVYAACVCLYAYTTFTIIFFISFVGPLCTILWLSW